MVTKQEINKIIENPRFENGYCHLASWLIARQLKKKGIRAQLWGFSDGSHVWLRSNGLIIDPVIWHISGKDIPAVISQEKHNKIIRALEPIKSIKRLDWASVIPAIEVEATELGKSLGE